MEKFECDNCGKSVTTRNGIIRHIKKCRTCERDNTKQVLKCSSCHKKFSSRSGLFYHKNKIHDRVDILESNCSTKCKDCDREFSSLAVYQQHRMKFHHNNSSVLAQKGIQCIYCPAVFPSRKGRLIHTKKQHLQPYLDRCTSINENLAVHQLYSCFYCKKCFSRKTNRAKHESVCKLSKKICEKGECNLGNTSEQETSVNEQVCRTNILSDFETHLSPENHSGPSSSVYELQEIFIGVEHGIISNDEIHSNEIPNGSPALNQIDISATEHSEEKINGIENKTSTNVDITPSLKHYIRDRKPFMQLSTPDCSTPCRSRINLEYGKATIKQFQRKVATLQQKNRRLQEKITTLHDLVSHLEKRNKISVFYSRM